VDGLIVEPVITSASSMVLNNKGLGRDFKTLLSIANEVTKLDIAIAAMLELIHIHNIAAPVIPLRYDHGF
jgi:hypothetical protein